MKSGNVHITYSRTRLNADMQPKVYKAEITIDGKVQVKQLQTISVFAEQEFKALAMQAAQDPRPCKVKFSWNENVWLERSLIYRNLELSVEFMNWAYVDKDK